MKQIICTILLLAALATRAVAQDASTFSKGEISTTDNHTGTIWLNELSKPDSILNYSIAVATYSSSAKLDGIFIPLDKFYLLRKAHPITRQKASRYKSFIKEMSSNVYPR